MSGSVVRSPARGDREDCSQSSVSSVAVSSGRCETPDRQDDFADFDLKIGDYVLPTHVPFRQPVVAFDQTQPNISRATDRFGIQKIKRQRKKTGKRDPKSLWCVGGTWALMAMNPLIETPRYSLVNQ